MGMRYSSVRATSNKANVIQLHVQNSSCVSIGGIFGSLLCPALAENRPKDTILLSVSTFSALKKTLPQTRAFQNRAVT